MRIGTSLAAASLLATATLAQAGSYSSQHQVTITNISKGVSFTPFIGAVHKHTWTLFSLGEPATDELAQIAEAGNTQPLYDLLDSAKGTYDIVQTEGLLMPGDSVSFNIETPVNKIWRSQFSLAAMLLPTNDTFVSLNGVRLPFKGSITYLANAYDAGSEPNDELCINVPGPTCGGEGYSPTVDGEGYVFPSPGTHGEGDLSVADYGWSGPVAKVTIKRTQ